MGEPHASIGLLCTDKYHFILNEVMRYEEGNTRIQTLWVDLLGVGSTGGCSGSTYALASANSSQLILSVTFFADGSKL